MKRPSVGRRWLPAPGLTLLLAVVWPVLNQSASAGQLLLGLVLGVAIPWFTHPLRERAPRLRRPLRLLRLTGVVLVDIVVSNLQVARRILGPEGAMRPGFVWVPLDIRDPRGIATLASIVTMTPGTLSADLAPDRRHLLVHALDLDDPQALVADIKARYEAPLREVFE